MKEKIARQTPLADYLRVLYRGRWIILASFLAVMAITVYLGMTAVPLYQASAKVMFKTESNIGLPGFEAMGYWQTETMISNQVEIIGGRALAKAVAQKLMQSEQAHELPILGAHKHLQSRSGRFSRFLNALFGSSAADDSRNEMQEPVLLEVETVARELPGYISVAPIRSTDMILLSVVSEDPQEAMIIANAYVEAYSELNRAMSQAEVRQVKNFLENQLGVIQQQLAESELALKDYLKGETPMTLTDETNGLVTKLVEFESLYKESLADLEAARERLKFIDQQLGKRGDIAAISATSFLDELKKEMADLQQQRAAYLAYLAQNGSLDENNARLQELDGQIERLTQKFRAELASFTAAGLGGPANLQDEMFMRKFEVEANIETLIPKVASLKHIVDDYAKKLESLPEKKLLMVRLQRSAQVDEKIFLMMKEKYEELRITEVGQLGDVRIIEPAELPETPLGPNRKLNIILGMILGLGLGVGLAFLLDMLDNSVRTMEDLERMGQPVLGSIPMIKEGETLARLKISKNGAPNGVHHGLSNGKVSAIENKLEQQPTAARLITHVAPKSPISEAYRALRTNIQYTHIDRTLRTLLVTSPGPGDGKSTSVANLAIVMAQMGSKVLLIDADLRRPVLHTVFNLDRRVGLSNVLVGRADIAEAVSPTDIENLHIMPCGALPPNPSELLGSSAMQRTLEALKQDYEVVLFDSPPVIAVTDAAVLARWVDGVFLVVKAGHTSKEAAFRSYALLNQVKAKVLGTLLNSVKVESMYGSYYYYYHYHYYTQNSNGKLPKTQRKLLSWPWG